MSKSTEVYPRLHDIARWAMVVCEILEVNIKTLEYVFGLPRSLYEGIIGSRAQVHCQSRYPWNPSIPPLLRPRDIQHELSLRFVSGPHEERNPTRVQRCGAERSAGLDGYRHGHESRQRDHEGYVSCRAGIPPPSPPTFISAVFSTTFFQFGADPQSWEVSDKFWLYWAVVVPVTMVCIAIWYMRFFRSAAVVSGARAKFVRQRDVGLSHQRDAYSNLSNRGYTPCVRGLFN